MTFTDEHVAVTGATGFLGGALVRRLAAEGRHIRALVRSPQKAGSLTKLGVSVIHGDITDAAAVRRALAGCKLVFHVAAGMNGGYDDMYPPTVLGTKHVIDAAAAEGTARVVHVSSIAVYNLNYAGTVREDKPIVLGAYPYAVTKALAEQAVQNGAVEFVVVRPGFIYGPGASLWTAGMFRLASMRPTPFLGDGSGSAHPIYVDDVVDMMCVLAEHPSAANQIFNCTPDPAPTWREFLGAYQRLTNNDSWFAVPLPLAYAIAAIAMMFSPPNNLLRDMPDNIAWLSKQRTYSMDKARALLGWQPSVPLEEGIERCAAWLRETGRLA